MPRASAIFPLSSLLLVTGLAAAQEPTIVLSAYAPPLPAPVLGSGIAADASVLPPDAASLPLRLSLLSAIYPLGPAFDGPACGTEAVISGGSIFPVQPYMQIRLAPRLVLHGFSDLGCPGDDAAGIDAGAGGALTYALPLAPSSWLVAGGGAYGIPAHGGPTGIPARKVIQGGLDLASKSRDGRTWSTGIGLSLLSPGLRVMPRVSGSF